MVGHGVVRAALEDARVDEVIVVNRRVAAISHPKVTEVVHSDFFDYADLSPVLERTDACAFCLGVSAAGKSEEEYHRLTFDLTLAAAHALHGANPEARFAYVSGQGTDSSERGRVMWARVKGKTENALLQLGFPGAFMLRPGYIQPVDGARSRTALYRGFYGVLSPFYPLIRRVAGSHVTDSTRLGRAMVRVLVEGSDKTVLEPRDIAALA